MPGVAGRSGRKPKPTQLKVIAGNPGHRKLNKSEPEYGLPTDLPCPEWMGEYGQEKWAELAPRLIGQKVLQLTDVQNLEVYCNAYDQFRLAQEEVRTRGVTVTGGTGAPIKNPAVTALKEATATMATYGSMLGLDPASRSRVMGGGGNKKSENPFEKLMGHG